MVKTVYHITILLKEIGINFGHWLVVFVQNTVLFKPFGMDLVVDPKPTIMWVGLKDSWTTVMRPLLLTRYLKVAAISFFLAGTVFQVKRKSGTQSSICSRYCEPTLHHRGKSKEILKRRWKYMLMNQTRVIWVAPCFMCKSPENFVVVLSQVISLH